MIALSCRGRRQLTESILPAVYERMLTKVKSTIDLAPFLSVTIDSWSSLACSRSLLSITAHILDEKMTPRCAILGAKPISGLHTANNLRAIVESCLTELGISIDRVHMMTRDAASTMRKLSRDMEIDSLDCFAHKLDLVGS